MRFFLLLSTATLAACQSPSDDGDAGQNAAAEASNAAGQPAGAANEAASDPDAPVSSDDPSSPTPPSERDKPASDCPIVRSSGWQAHVNAMPGLDSDNRPRLIVRGDVTVPTGGYKVSLRMGQVAESYPVQVTVLLDATPPQGPATQALETREARGSFPSEERVGSVTVRCGSRLIARISPVETAH